MTIGPSENTPFEGENPLTEVYTPYTLAGTPNGSEVDRIMIENFLNTLAEVALSVASREEASQ